MEEKEINRRLNGATVSEEEWSEICTYTRKMISKVVSDNDKETIKEIARYCEENNIYLNLIREERLKEVIELGLKSEVLQRELYKANDKLKKIEEYVINYIEVEPDEGNPYAVKVEFKEILKKIKGDEDK